MPSQVPNPHFNPSDTDVALGKRVRVYREGLNMTLEEACSIFGLSTFTLASIETATRPVTLPSLTKIAAGMNLSVQQLMEDCLPKVGKIDVGDVQVSLLRAMEGLKMAGEHIKAAYQAAKERK